MHKKISFILLLLTLSASSVYAADRETAEAAIQAATEANQKAAEMGFEWRDTKSALLEPAQKALKTGNYNEAIELANQALNHAESGMQQAKLAEKATLRPLARAAETSPAK